MYKLPSSFNPESLKGKALEIVCFTANTVNLSFDEGVSITIMSSFAHQRGAMAEPVESLRVPVDGSHLMQLVGHAIAGAGADDHGTLTLIFDNGQIVQIFDDSDSYESYRINDGTREIVV